MHRAAPAATSVSPVFTPTPGIEPVPPRSLRAGVRHRSETGGPEVLGRLQVAWGRSERPRPRPVERGHSPARVAPAACSAALRRCSGGISTVTASTGTALGPAQATFSAPGVPCTSITRSGRNPAPRFSPRYPVGLALGLARIEAHHVASAAFFVAEDFGGLANGRMQGALCRAMTWTLASSAMTFIRSASWCAFPPTLRCPHRRCPCGARSAALLPFAAARRRAALVAFHGVCVRSQKLRERMHGIVRIGASRQVLLECAAIVSLALFWVRFRRAPHRPRPSSASSSMPRSRTVPSCVRRHSPRAPPGRWCTRCAHASCADRPSLRADGSPRARCTRIRRACVRTRLLAHAPPRCAVGGSPGVVGTPEFRSGVHPSRGSWSSSPRRPDQAPPDATRARRAAAS